MHTVLCVGSFKSLGTSLQSEKHLLTAVRVRGSIKGKFKFALVMLKGQSKSVTLYTKFQNTVDCARPNKSVTDLTPMSRVVMMSKAGSQG